MSIYSGDNQAKKPKINAPTAKADTLKFDQLGTSDKIKKKQKKK